MAITLCARRKFTNGHTNSKETEDMLSEQSLTVKFVEDKKQIDQLYWRQPRNQN